VGRPAALFLDNAPTHCDRAAMQVFRERNVRVILYPAHLAHVLLPVDGCGAKQFKAKLMEACQRPGKRCAAQAAFQELGEDMQRASPTRRERVRMALSICVAALAVINLSWDSGRRGWPLLGSSQAPRVPVRQAGGDSGGAARLSFRGGGGRAAGGASRRALRLGAPRRPPLPGDAGSLVCRPTGCSKAGRTARRGSHPRSGHAAGSGSTDGEDFNVPDAASEAEVDLLDVGALDGDALAP
jgi:hypothetical protein